MAGGDLKGVSIDDFPALGGSWVISGDGFNPPSVDFSFINHLRPKPRREI